MEKGQPFEKFVMRCARNFGALIMMRDDSMDAPIPEFKPSEFYSKAKAEAAAELARLEGMSERERTAFGKQKQAAEIRQAEEIIAKETIENARIDEAMMNVAAWEPPTKDHVGLKEFMVEQLNTSRNDMSYWHEAIAKAKKKSPSAYYIEELNSAARSIDRYEEEDRKEIERTNGRNEWVRQLRDSFQQQTVVG